jgi:hypothetical protein
MLLGRALKGRRDQARLSVKFGALRAPDGSWLGVDARPAAVKNFLAHSLHRLGVDYVDVYRPARLDPAVPIEDTIGAIAEMVKAGYVRNIEHNPHVRLKLREGLRVHWHTGTAHLLSDDDPRERQRWLVTQLPSSAGNARAVRLFGTQLLTVRIDLDSLS